MAEQIIKKNYNRNIFDNSQSRSSSSSYSRKKSRSSSNSKDNSHHSRSIYKKYTLEFKTKIIKLAEDKSLSYIEKNYGIARHLVRKQIKDKDSIFSNKNTSYKIIKNGGISSTVEYDGLIASYIKDLRESNIPVNTTDVIIYAKEIVPFFKDRTIFSLKNWASRFFRRMGFSFRIVTKAQTNLRDDIKEYLNKFYFIIRNIIKEKNILVHRENIGNADETPIILEMNEKKTLNVIGDKEIKVKSFNKTHLFVARRTVLIMEIDIKVII